MADFGGLGAETDDGTGQEQQRAGPDPAIRRGLLSPSSFPSILPGGSPAEANGPAIAPRPPILSWPLDQDVHAEVLQDILDAQAMLPPLAPAQRSGDPANWDGGWLNPPAPLIAGPLDADTHAEVLRDIQNAQAQLPPASPQNVYSSGNSGGGQINQSSDPSYQQASYNGLGEGGAGGANYRSVLVGDPQSGTDLILNLQSNGQPQQLRLAVPDGTDFSDFTVRAGPYSADLIDKNGNSVGSRSYDSYLGVPTDPVDLAATTLASDQARQAQEVVANERDPVMQALAKPVLLAMTLGDPLVALAFNSASNLNSTEPGVLFYPGPKLNVRPSILAPEGTAVPVTGTEPSSSIAAEWTPPAGFQMPAIDKGEFLGTIGNSDFAISDAAAAKMGLPSGSTIPWVEGIPDFGAHTVPGPKGLAQEFDVPGLTGDHGTDRALVLQQMSADTGMSQRAIQRWLSENDVALHHSGGESVQIVPEEIHGLHHSGGAQQLRGGN